MDIVTLTLDDVLQHCKNGSIMDLTDKCIRVTGGRLCGLNPVPTIKQLDKDNKNYSQAVAIYFHPKNEEEFASIEVNSEITVTGILNTPEKSLWNDYHVFIQLNDCCLG